jgi:murein L,D-transpeptidase YafK
VHFDRERLRQDLAAAGRDLGDPAHIRILKRERRLELWMEGRDGRYSIFRGYDICAFSGELGPKLAEGDLQAPEGFYKVGSKQLNPASRHHLAFNLGYPNAYDRQHDRTGSALMVHGGCSSAGCYAIGDQNIDEVYAVVEAALRNGQAAVDVHAFPFLLTETALAGERDHPWYGFWRNLQQGFACFTRAGRPPAVAACGGEYRFGRDAEDPACVPIAAWS